MSDFAFIARLAEHPGNIRDDLGDLTELANSIREHGILQPLVVRSHPQRHGQFVVLAGHRRLAAAKLAGLEKVPITIRESAGPTRDIEIMLVENCQRRDLGPIEKAEAMGKLRERGYTQARIAKATGLTISTVSYYLTFLDLDPASREQVRDGTVRATDVVQAVRASRQRRRQRSGSKPMGAAMTWEPDHFTTTHPLARKAKAMCDAREHNNRRRLGKACGQCWETVIRADERVAAAALEVVS